MAGAEPGYALRVKGSPAGKVRPFAPQQWRPRSDLYSSGRSSNRNSRAMGTFCLPVYHAMASPKSGGITPGAVVQAAKRALAHPGPSP